MNDKKKEKSIVSVYREKIKTDQETSKAYIRLNKLYNLSKNRPTKSINNLTNIISDPDILFSAYNKLKTNYGSMTKGIDSSTADEMTFEKIQNISKQIKKGIYEWKPVRRVFVPKPGKTKMRPLGIPTFNDRIVQEAIRLTLNAIYEPIFQTYELNFGFRPKRSTTHAIEKINSEKQGMTTAIEGDIAAAYDNVDKDKLMETLKEKISDKKLIKLIKTNLNAGAFENKKTIHSLTGVPQGGIASPILFNIYMHNFDLKVCKLVEEILENKNVIENRATTTEKAYSTRYSKIRHKISNLTQRYFNLQKNKIKVDNKTIYLKKEEYLEKRKVFRKLKSLQRNTKSISQKKSRLRFSYTRYADDWIILTNADINTCQNIKEKIKDLLQQEFKLQLSEEKTAITNILKNSAKFLGYRIFQPTSRKVVSSFNITLQREIRKARNIGPRISIDYDRINKRLELEGILEKEKFMPTHCKKYINLKPWQVVEKFSQKVTGLFNYYFDSITFKSDLNRYYYILRYSCLKTLANIKKTSIRSIIQTYGQDIKINYNELTKDLDTGLEKKLEKTVQFPTYKQIMFNCQALYQTRLNEKIARIIRNKEAFNKYKTIAKDSLTQKFPEITFSDILTFKSYSTDPFMTTNINLRSSFQLQKYCCICGCPNSHNNPIQSHHLRHIRKGKVTGFSEILKALNRKTIPVCSKCHKQIHNGSYDGLALREFFDPALAQV